MANRLITQVESQAGLLGVIAADFALNPSNRLLGFKSATEITVLGSNHFPLRIDNKWFYLDTDTDISTATDLDTGAIAAGTDYYVYACDNVGALVFLISAANTFPSGYNADTSRKIGGFHTLCVNVGTISGHPLTGYTAKAILPASVWDLTHRPMSEPEGMVWSAGAGVWVDIYLTSGTGASTASVNGGTISHSRDWMDFVDDFAAVKKQLLTDAEFQIIAAGSNEMTNIHGSADPVTTGGYSDTASRRMVSNIGCEGCCGQYYQWLSDQSYRFDGAANHTHQVTVSGDPETVTSGDPSGAIAPVWAWETLPGSKGSIYRQGTYGDIKVRAGGNWGIGSACGSRCRAASDWRWVASSVIGGRGRAAQR